jgi:hypothetical protein
MVVQSNVELTNTSVVTDYEIWQAGMADRIE